MKTFQRNCCSYFMEVVSRLCFGQDSAPKRELITILMEIIFTDDQTRELTPFTDGRTDKTPTIRSPLLQLLLDYKYWPQHLAKNSFDLIILFI